MHASSVLRLLVHSFHGSHVGFYPARVKHEKDSNNDRRWFACKTGDDRNRHHTWRISRAFMYDTPSFQYWKIRHIKSYRTLRSLSADPDSTQVRSRSAQVQHETFHP